jgi:glycosyltransferase involved in cell wall biosynthesis
MKIVLLQDDFPPESLGGAGNMAASLALALKELGHEVIVIAATQARERAGAGEWRGIPVHRVYSAYHERWRAYLSLYNPQTVGEVRRLLGTLEPDVVHAHNVHYHLSYYALVLAKRRAGRVLLTAHDEMLFHYGKFYECVETGEYAVHWRQIAKRFTKRWNPLRNVLIRRMMRGVSVASLSFEHQKALLANGYKSVVVYNGMDPAGWPAPDKEAEAFRLKHALAGKKVVLFAGRISRLKGAEAARRMILRVRQAIPEAVLLVAGAKGERSDDAAYTGWLSSDEMRAAYAASDIVIFPSIYFDPFGLINLEAMASGKPVVATRFGGAPEIVVDGETGFVVDPRDEGAFAPPVLRLLRNPEEAKKLGQAGRTRLLGRFTARRMAEAYASMYTA